MQLLVGFLSFCSQAERLGRVFMRRLWELINDFAPRTTLRKIPAWVKEDLEWWNRILPTYYGVLFFHTRNRRFSPSQLTWLDRCGRTKLRTWLQIIRHSMNLRKGTRSHKTPCKPPRPPSTERPKDRAQMRSASRMVLQPTTPIAAG